MLKKPENQNLPPRFRKVIATFHHAISKSQLGFKGVAEKLGKSLSQLYDECNSAPAKMTAGKLGVEDAIEIMRITGNIEPLRAIAAELSCAILKHARVPDITKSETEYFIALDKALLSFKQAASDAQPYSDMILAMTAVSTAMGDLVVLAQARDECAGLDDVASRVMLRKAGCSSTSPAVGAAQTEKRRSWWPFSRKQRGAD